MKYYYKFLIVLFAVVSFNIKGYSQGSQFGIVLSGMEWGSGTGTVNSSYYLPTQAEFTYYSGLGFKLFRIPFLWERMQPTLGGSLDPTYLGYLDQVVGYATNAGVSVFIDCHNYARYPADPSTSSSSTVITQGGPTQAQYNNLWTQLAAHYASNTTVWGYDIMNEPHDLGSANWPAIVQSVVNAIRTVDTQHTILVEGDHWSQGNAWPTLPNSTGLASVSDPNNNLVFEAHQYFDSNMSGTYSSTSFSGNTPTGSANTDTSGRQLIRPFVNWIKQNNLHGMVGEYGIPNDASSADQTNWNSLLGNFLSYLSTNCIYGTYWAGGPGWGNGYVASCEPLNNNYTTASDERPQMPTMATYTGFASSCTPIGSGGTPNPVSVTITSPASSAELVLGNNITITASPSTTSGTITQVAFYNGTTLIGTATSGTYSITWAPTTSGNFSITATATGSTGQSATAVVSVQVLEPVYKTNTAPVIDGVAEALWNNYPASNITNVTEGTVPNSTYLSANWKASWDATNLYVLVTVTDNTLVNNNQTNVYDDDGIELYIDIGNTKTTTYGSNQFQYEFRWNDTKIYSSGGNATTGIKLGQTSQGITAGCTNKCAAQGYTMEVSIPWSTLGTTAPAIGALEGFDVAVNDDDDGTRDAKIDWNATTDNDYQDPALFGTVIMEPSPCTPPPATITAAGSTSFCPGGSVVLNANTGTGYTYQWVNNGTSISGATASSYTASASGTYTVMVTSSGCSGTSNGTTVTVNTVSPAVTAAGPTSFNAGGSVVLNANTGTGISYQWYNSGTVISGATASSYTATTSGTYTVTEAISGCPGIASTGVVINVKNVSVSITSPTNNANLSGAITITATATANGSTVTQVAFYANGKLIGTATNSPYTITWSNPTGGSTQLIAIATDAKSEVDTSAAITVNITTPVYNTTTAPVIDGVAEALWTNYPASALTHLVEGSSTNNTANWKATWDANNVYVLVTVMDNMLVNDNQSGIYNDDGIEIYFDFGNTKTATYGNNQFQFAFRWNDPKVYELQHNVTTGVKMGQTSQGITAGCTNNCAAQGYTMEISIPWTTLTATKAPAIGALEGFDVMVNDDDDGTRDSKISWNATADNDYTSPSNFGTVIMEGSPCTPPTATITAGGATTFCKGGSVVLSANTGAGYTYQWSNSGTPIAGATSASYTATTSGTYTVAVTSNNCTGTSAGTVVTVNTPVSPAITPAGPTTFTFGGSVVLNANTGTGITYQWSNAAGTISGATKSSYTATAAGTYTVTETAGGCSATSTGVVVTVKNVSVSITSPANNTTEAGGNVTLTATASANGSTITQLNFYANGTLIGTATNSPYTIIWSNASSGSYQITAIATDANSEVDTSAAIALTLIEPVYSTTAAPVIDGVAEALWNNYPASSLNNVIIGTVSSPAYLSANWKATWDANNVYVLVTVMDDVLVNTKQPTSGLYNDDGIEVYFDFGNTKTTTYGNNQFQFAFRWNDATVYELQHNATTGVKMGQTSQGITAGCTTNCAAIGYTVEISIPWATLTATKAPAVGALEGFDVMVNDDDTGTRNAKISWNATSDNDYNNPSLFGTIIMEGAPCTPPIATITPAGTASFCTGGNLKLTASTGTGYTYQWYNGGTAIVGATASTYAATAAGTYTVVVKNSTGCAATSAATTVTVNTLPTATITAATSTTFCSGGSVVLNANAGPGLTYQWNNAGTAISGATAASYTATASGTYTVTVTNANNCSTTSTATTVIVNPLPAATITATGNTIFCTGGSVVLNANTGAGLTYQWNSAGTAITGATNSSYSATTAGNYTVTVTNANNCSATSSVTAVTVNSLPTATVTPASSTTFCTGGSVVLNANTGSGLTYQWSNGTTAISGATIANYTAATAGTYTVAITNANNCSSTSAGTSVVVNSLPAATITAAGNTTFCTGGNVTLNANTGTGLTYQWNNGGTAISGATGSSYITTSAGSYTVVVTNANNCSATSAQTTVTVNASPSATITAAGSTAFCAGGSVVLNANTGTGLTYQWSNGASTISGATSSSYTASSTGSYTVTVTNANNCSATSTASSVTVNTPPTATITATGNTTFCIGGSVVLNANAGTGLTYQWNNNGTAIVGSTGSSYTASVAGSYTVVVTNASNCSATSAATTVTVNTLPSASITLGSSGSFCTGGSIALNANTGTGLTYQWNNGGTAISGATNSSYTATASGTYTVIETNANNCSATSSPTTISVNSSPTATITASGSTTFCTGGNVVLNTNTGTGLTYQWSNGGTAIGGATNSSYTATTSGTYTVTITDASSSCSATSGGTNVTVNTLPTATVTAVGSTSFCIGGSVVLNANTGAGLTYQWNVGGAAISAATSSSYTATATGLYSVTVVNSGNCSVTSSTTNVTANALPTVTLSGASAICNGGSASLAATPAGGKSPYTYSWSPSASLNNAAISNPTATPSATTTYTVTVSDANLCQNTASAIVAVNQLPVPIVLASGATAFCVGGNVILNANTGTGLTYQWNNGGTAISGATNASYTAAQSGTYTVTEKNSNGCSGTSSGTTVTVYTLPTATITAGGNTIFCQGGSVTLNATTGTGLSYQWSAGGSAIAAATNASYTTSTAGIYTVAVQNSNGCSVTSSSVTVGVNSLPTVNASASNPTICSGASTMLTASATGSSPYTYSWSPTSSVSVSTISNPLASPTTPTTYTVLVTDANGCQNSASVPVMVNNLPAATATASGATAFCQGGSVTLYANSGTGLSYQWNNSSGAITGATNASYSATTSDTYIVTVTNSNGCSAASNGVSVSVSLPPTVSNAGPNQYVTTASAVLAANAPSVGTGSWSLVSGTATFTNTAQAATSVSNLSTGANMLEWTISNGSCPVSTSIVTINVGSTPPPQTITGLTKVDTGATGVTYAVPSLSGVHNHWTTPAGATIVGYNADSSQVTIDFGTGSGNVAVIQTNQYGSTTSSLAVQVGNSPSPQTISGPADVAIGATGVTYSVTSNPGSKYHWSLPPGVIITSANTDSSQVTVSFGSTGGNVAVTETNSFGSTTNTLPVTVGALPSSQQITGPATVISASTGITYSVTPQSGVTNYHWSLPPGATIVSASADSSQIVVNFGSAGGNVTVAETNAFGITTDTLPVAVGTAPTTQTITGPTSVTAVQTGVTYTVPSQSGTIYHWTLPAGSTITSANVDSSQVTVSFGNTSGNVIATATNPFGTASDTLAINVAQTTGIITAGTTEGYQIYPNPFSGSTTIIVNSPVNEKITLSIIDVQGVTCYTSSDYYTNQQIKIGSQLSSDGVYFVQISHGNEVKVIKAVKVD